LSSLIELDLSNNYLNGDVGDGIKSFIEVTNFNLDLSNNMLTGQRPDNIIMYEKVNNNCFNDCESTYGSSNQCNENCKTYSMDCKYIKNLYSEITEDGNKPFENVGDNCCGVKEDKFIKCETIGGVNRIVKISITDLNSDETLEINENIGKISELVELNLSGNSLEGSIPKSINQLSKLVKINLSNNKLSDIIPEMPNKSGLEDLELNNNCFIGLAPVIDTSTYPINYKYDGNCFSGKCNNNDAETRCNIIRSSECNYIKDLYKQIAGYEYVGNYCCGINGIDCKSITEGSQNKIIIESIDLSSKGLTGNIPSEIVKLNDLVKLNLYNNRLSGNIPSIILDGNENPKYLTDLTKLKSINLSYNKLTGTIPSEIGSEIEEIKLDNNLLTGFIHDIYYVNRDISYGISNKYSLKQNCFNLCRPDSVCNTECGPYSNDCEYIKPLIIQVTGNENIDNNCCNIKGITCNNNRRITEIDLSGKGLTGEIPPEITKDNMGSLNVLNLSNNKLKGSIGDDGILSFTRQQGSTFSLDISNNLLTGEKPDKIETDKINNNCFNGCVTAGDNKCNENCDNYSNDCQYIKSLYSKIKTINKFDNVGENCCNVDDSIKCEKIGGVNRITEITIKGLNGDNVEIPSEIGYLSELTVLSLSENKLIGEIPNEIGMLSELKKLDLSKNSLTGSIPKSIVNLYKLTNIDLSNNRLTEIIPEIPNKAKLVELKLNDNLFIGPTPVISSNVYKKLNTDKYSLANNCFSGTYAESGTCSDACSRIYSSDCANIKSLYIQMDGYEYVGDYCCGIEGIECSGNIENSCFNNNNENNRKITSIDLSGKRLTGNIPSTIDKLDKLMYLNLNNNQLSGILPSGIKSLSSLKNLILSNNKLTGPVPESLPSGINEVKLDNNLFTGIVYNAYKIDNGNIKDNYNLKNNCFDDCDQDCNSECAPYSYDCVYIQSLFTQIPGNEDKIYNCCGVDKTSGIGIKCSSYNRITSINLSGQELTGEIPSGIKSISYLDELNLSDNKLNSIPEDLLEKLKTIQNQNKLNLNNNLLTGELPSDLKKDNINNNCFNKCDVDIENVGDCNDECETYSTDCKYIYDLYSKILDYSVVGSNCCELGSGSSDGSKIECEKVDGVKRVKKIYITGLSSESSIPSDIGKLTELTELNISANREKLIGVIPESIENLTKLTKINLSDNSLTGSIPKSIINLSKLTSINFSGNNLSEVIPEMPNKSGLEELKLNDNKFIGLPPVIDSYTFPKLFSVRRDGPKYNVEDNCFRGTCLGNACTKCNEIKSNECEYINALYGQISGYEYVGQYCCGISGIDCITDTENVNNNLILSINFSDKGLTGNIPFEIVKLSKLQSLNLSNNHLTGGIPYMIENNNNKYLTDISSLESLDLSYNRLNGEIPAKPSSNIDKLLNLSYNLFTGSIPGSYKNSGTLKTNYNLNQNCFNGCDGGCNKECKDISYDCKYISELFTQIPGNEDKIYNCCGVDSKGIGITCNNNRITSINLPGKGLTGVIPSDIVNLEVLSEL